MSQSKHTPEPWSYYQCASGVCGIQAEKHRLPGDIARVGCPGNDPDTRRVAEADAARIVACVNACAGLNPEGVAGLRAVLDRSVKAGEPLHRQLSDARNVVEQDGKRGWIVTPEVYKDFIDAIRDAKAALAAVRGTK